MLLLRYFCFSFFECFGRRVMMGGVLFDCLMCLMSFRLVVVGGCRLMMIVLMVRRCRSWLVLL